MEMFALMDEAEIKWQKSVLGIENAKRFFFVVITFNQ